MKKRILMLFTLLMIGGVSIMLVACGAVQPPEIKDEIESVSISYNQEKVTNGIISIDLTAQTITISTTIEKQGNPDTNILYSSSDTDIAEINAQGKISLKKTGETIISATVGDKKQEIVLIVGQNSSSVDSGYSITVEGGNCNVERAKAGEQVSLSIAQQDFKEQHKEFVEWQYLNADDNQPLQNLWINGNNFRMPANNVLIKAVSKDKLYTLNVVDATIKSAVSGEQTITPVATTQENVATYELPYESQVTVQANQEKEGEMFVGWDYAVNKNRVGNVAEKEYSFKMPDETLTVFGKFSKTSDLSFSSVSFGTTKTAISQGKIGEKTDSDLEGMSGYRISLRGDTGASSDGYKTENFTGVGCFSTLRFGSQTVNTIFKNHSDYPMTLEFYAVSYSTVATTGVFTVDAHSVKKVPFIASAGFHNPSFALVLRQGLEGTADMVDLDMVYETADTYPDGDPQFKVIDAQYVTLESRKPTAADYPANSGIRNDCYSNGPTVGSNPTGPLDGSFGGRKNVNNNNGITNLVTRDGYINDTSPFLTAKLSNVPTYTEEDSDVTVYFRVINTNSAKTSFIFGLGTAENPLNDDSRVSHKVTLEGNDVFLFAIKIKRTSAQDNIYFTIVKEEKNVNNDYNLIIQMLYNNKIGVQNENIVSKN